jgi:hypothetical protein
VKTLISFVVILQFAFNVVVLKKSEGGVAFSKQQGTVKNIISEAKGYEVTQELNKLHRF